MSTSHCALGLQRQQFSHRLPAVDQPGLTSLIPRAVEIDRFLAQVPQQMLPSQTGINRKAFNQTCSFLLE